MWKLQKITAVQGIHAFLLIEGFSAKDSRFHWQFLPLAWCLPLLHQGLQAAPRNVFSQNVFHSSSSEDLQRRIKEETICGKLSWKEPLGPRSLFSPTFNKKAVLQTLSWLKPCEPQDLHEKHSNQKICPTNEQLPPPRIKKNRSCADLGSKENLDFVSRSSFLVHQWGSSIQSISRSIAHLPK